MGFRPGDYDINLFNITCRHKLHDLNNSTKVNKKVKKLLIIKIKALVLLNFNNKYP